MKPDFSSLGKNIQAIRASKGLSLSQLALSANIAKSNLSRIEQGAGNPTIDTIWRLAVQLDTPFGDLVSNIEAPIGEDGVQVKLIDRGIDNPRVDVYWMSCAPHTTKISEPHIKGTSESITLISGTLWAGEEQQLKRTEAGESHHFQADTPHCYQTQEDMATLIMFVKYPKQKKETASEGQ
ncbi:helix-turn-helix domain-containing protein [Marinomonas epiphytica]